MDRETDSQIIDSLACRFFLGGIEDGLTMLLGVPKRENEMECKVKIGSSIAASSLTASIPDIVRAAMSEAEFTHSIRTPGRNLISGPGGNFVDLSYQSLFVVGGRNSIAKFLDGLGGSEREDAGPGICYENAKLVFRISFGREERTFAKNRTVLQVQAGQGEGRNTAQYQGKITISSTQGARTLVYWGTSFKRLGNLAEQLFGQAQLQHGLLNLPDELPDDAFGRPIMAGEFAMKTGYHLK